MPRVARWFVPIAIVYFAALAGLACGEALLSPHSVISAPDMDIDRYFYSIRTFIFERIAAGKFPLWNPHIFGGMPTLGNFQYAMLYPPNWLHLLLPVGLAIDVIVALHLALAGLLTSLWCRWRGAGVVAALVGGTIFMFSGPLMTRLYGGHLTFLCVVAWAPLVLWCVDAIIERRAERQVRFAFLVGAAAVAMQVLAGYPQPVHNTFLVALVYAGLRLIRATHRRPAAGWIAGMYLLGAALSAAQLLPALDAGREMVRGGDLPAAFSVSFSLPPENLLTTIVPHLFGDEFTAPYLGRWAVWETSLFVGTIGALLAVLGLVFCGSWRNRALAIVGLVVILLALGRYTPLYPLLLKLLPGLEQFRGPARIGFLATLMIAVLAAEGFDWLWRAAPRRLLFIAGVAAACGFVLMLCGAVVRANQQLWLHVLTWLSRTAEQWPAVIAGYDAAIVERSSGLASAQLLRSGLSLVEVAIVLALVSRRRAWACVLVVLLLGQVWVASQPFRQKFQPYRHAPVEWRAALEALGPDDRVLVTDERWLNLPAQLGIESISGYDPSLSRRWANVVAPLTQDDPLLGTLSGARWRPSPLWMMLRLRTTLPPDNRVVQTPMTRLHLIDRCRVVAGPAEAVAAVHDPAFDPRRIVILEQAPRVWPVDGGGEPPGIARLVRLADDRLEITVELTRPAILLVSDAYSKGWRCRPFRPGPQDGYDVLPANHAWRAIPLAAGAHHLVLEYRPVSVALGAVVSGAAVLAWLIAWIVRTGWRGTAPDRTAATRP